MLYPKDIFHPHLTNDYCHHELFLHCLVYSFLTGLTKELSLQFQLHFFLTTLLISSLFPWFSDFILSPLFLIHHSLWDTVGWALHNRPCLTLFTMPIKSISLSTPSAFKSAPFTGPLLTCSNDIIPSPTALWTLMSLSSNFTLLLIMTRWLPSIILLWSLTESTFTAAVTRDTYWLLPLPLLPSRSQGSC